ncbi:hypothetical protein IscW_ISCW014337 [Ixodes scapularis]|uniref:Uncharacterized protein n=1 Tax=Ixodes scapularis TaxID=6945 RepID=B7QJX2_IXOSC|nr:hypothetical protein IscW_ISCW014337 [Ixodes scapularis]|eukprot:XP_002415479.1 hypothetical protein IscW_ISCW014337 [Ixodes scapularis]
MIPPKVPRSPGRERHTRGREAKSRSPSHGRHHDDAAGERGAAVNADVEPSGGQRRVPVGAPATALHAHGNEEKGAGRRPPSSPRRPRCMQRPLATTPRPGMPGMRASDTSVRHVKALSSAEGAASSATSERMLAGRLPRG